METAAVITSSEKNMVDATYGISFCQRNLLFEEIWDGLIIKEVYFYRIIEIYERLNEYSFLSNSRKLLILETAAL